VIKTTLTFELPIHAYLKLVKFNAVRGVSDATCGGGTQDNNKNSNRIVNGGILCGGSGREHKLISCGVLSTVVAKSMRSTPSK
jgi:hypothetical protein